MPVESGFTHFDSAGNARMVDVSAKGETLRRATARGRITMSEEAYSMVRSGSIKKGDVLGVARIAGIMAAKKVDQLIPLCHPLAVTGIDLIFNFVDFSGIFVIISNIPSFRVWFFPHCTL